jgi:aldehyde:ferredoxin oxidoreductase
MTLDWLNRCYKSGVITPELIGIDMSKLGSLEFFDKFAKMIAFREGFGDVLAQGLEQAAQEIGGEAPQKIRHSDPYDPRIYLTTALIWAVEPREPIQALHEVGYPLSQWTTGVMGKHKTHVTSDVIKGIAKRFWGSEAAGDFTTIEGKALAAKMIQDRQYAKESLILCDWIYPISDGKYSEDHLGDPTLESKFLATITGMDVDEQGLYCIGERIFNQQRAALIRDGHKGREDDRLPEEWHTQPLKRGMMDPDCLVPDGDGNPVSRVGSVLDRNDFDKMKDEYYQLRGWNTTNGLQTRKKLEELDLRDVADDLERRGCIS